MENWCQQHALASFHLAAGGFLLILAYLIWGAGPLLFHRSTRPIVPFLLLGSSFMVGTLTWLWCALLTTASFGFGGLIVGILLAGLGVVPLGIIAVLRNNAWIPAASIIVGIVATFTLRALGGVVVSLIERSHQSGSKREPRRCPTWLRWLLVPIATVCVTWLFTSTVEVLIWPLADSYGEPAWTTEAFRFGGTFCMPYVAIIAGARTAPAKYSFVVASILASLALAWGLTGMGRTYLLPYLLGLLVAWISFWVTRKTQPPLLARREARP